VTRSPGVAIGWRPGTYMSDNGGTSFRDISPAVVGITAPPETNDPFIWVDQETGRVFSFHMAPILACAAMMSFTDNQGASWTTTPLGCGGQLPYDHQTMVASKPRTVVTQGYPNVLTQCVNAVHSEECSHSLDGGITWLPTPAYANEYASQLCGTQTGHMAAAPDGTIYLPTPLCAHSPAVYVSDNDGLTWTRRVIDGTKSIPFVDPAIAVDELGNVYASFIDSDGSMWYSVSKDKAVTWSTPVLVAEGITGHLPALDVGDPGKVVVAFPGTDDLEDGFATPGYPSGDADLVNSVEWHAYMAISYNALDAAPTFEVVRASGDDPLVRRAECSRGNRCGYHVDFIDVTIGPNGYPYAASIDGCTNVSCITNPLASNNEGANGKGVIATLASGTPLCATGCAYRFGGIPTAPGARRLNGR